MQYLNNPLLTGGLPQRILMLPQARKNQQVPQMFPHSTQLDKILSPVNYVAYIRSIALHIILHTRQII